MPTKIARVVSRPRSPNPVSRSVTTVVFSDRRTPDNLGADERQRRLARAGGDLVQPDPRRRDPGLEVPRQGHDRHDPDPAHRRARPDRTFGPPAAPAPAPAMALGTRLAGDATAAHGPPASAT